MYSSEFRYLRVLNGMHTLECKYVAIITVISLSKHHKIRTCSFQIVHSDVDSISDCLDLVHHLQNLQQSTPCNMYGNCYHSTCFFSLIHNAQLILACGKKITNYMIVFHYRNVSLLFLYYSMWYSHEAHTREKCITSTVGAM